MKRMAIAAMIFIVVISLVSGCTAQSPGTASSGLSSAGSFTAPSLYSFTSSSVLSSSVPSPVSSAGASVPPAYTASGSSASSAAVSGAYQPPADAKKYENSNYKYSLFYPGSWTQASRYNAALFTAPTSGASVNVIVEPSSSVPLVNEASIKTELNGSVRVYTLTGSSTKDAFAGKNAFSAAYNITQNKKTFACKRYYVQSGGNVYIITFTSLPSDSAAQQQFDVIMHSFTF